MVGRTKLFLLLLPMLALPLLGAAQKQETSRYFPETGHTVRGAFLVYFDSRGGLGIFGYPITNEFVDPQSGMLLQYFQRARMEWHPTNPDPYKVQLGLLGDEMGKRKAPLSPSEIPTTPDCQYFMETGQAICYSFLSFFYENGGLDTFGYPISGFDVENGFTVQYFQRARMEWHPEKPTGQRIQLANLGSVVYDLNRLNPDLLAPQTPNNAAPQLTNLQLRASVSVPVAQLNGLQTVYLVVKDQYNKPVAGATATMVVHFPNGDRSFNMPATDASGTTKFSFAINDGKPGEYLRVEYAASLGGITRTTSTSFLLWW